MLDLFVIFTSSGIVLWSFQDQQQSSGNPINGLIQDRIIEGYEGAEDTYLYNDRQYVQYSRDNVRNLIFAAVYSKVVAGQVGYVEPLLAGVQRTFGSQFDARDAARKYADYEYDETFESLYKTVQEQQHEQDREAKMRKFEDTKKFVTTVAGSGVTEQEINERTSTNVDKAATELVTATAEQLRKQKLEALKNRKRGGSSKSKKGQTTPHSPNRTSRIEEKPVRMDYSDQAEYTAAEITSEDLARYQQEALQLGEGMGEVDYGTDEDLLGTTEESKATGLFSFFSSLTGSSTLTAEKLAPALDQMKNHLISKNVAADIAEKVSMTFDLFCRASRTHALAQQLLYGAARSRPLKDNCCYSASSSL
eukprot:m.289760 g.289760  ORF g.289760 m.289760 type:complete len:364 (+) comp17801_c0_seq2:119-1210(+)